MLKSLFEILRALPRRERKLLPWFVFFSFVTTGLECLGIGLIFPVLLLMTDLNRALANPHIAGLYAWAGFQSPMHFIYASGAAVLVVLILKNLASAAIGIWAYYVAQRIGMSLSVELFSRYMHAPYVWHIQRNSSTLMRNVDAAITTLVESMIAILLLFNEFLVAVGVVAVLVYLDPMISLFLALFVVLLGGGYYLLTKRVNFAAGTHLMRVLAELLQTMQEAMGAIKEIRVLGREQRVVSKFAATRRDAMRWRTTFGALHMLPHYVVEISIGIAMVLLLFFVLQTQGEKALPMLGVIGAAGLRLIPFANRSLKSLQLIRSAEPAANLVLADYRALRSLETHEVKQSGADDKTMGGGSGLELRNVSFHYGPKGPWALREISLHLPKGKSLGVVGMSGAGKTTLVDLITGLLVPDSGVIAFDGRDIHADLKAWCSRIGYVPQNVFLTDETFAQNIALGIPEKEIDQARLWTAIERACLDDLLKTVPGGASAHLGERGVRISGGQRQRVGIARALYHDPEVLVLDEATSALDNETEARLSDIVTTMVGEKTVIIIAHRLSTVKNCDYIAFLKDGQLADIGEFEALLRRNQEFADMVAAGRLEPA